MLQNVNLLPSFLFFFLLASENKHYLQVYLDYCDYKIVGKQMIGYLDDNLFESHEN